jgi:hypothetical protein
MVFGELRGLSWNIYAQVAGGSLLMASGALAVAFSSATTDEYSSWREAAERECKLYGIERGYVLARMDGRDENSSVAPRTWVDWLLISAATAVFVAFAAVARVPHMNLQWEWMAALTSAMLLILIGGGIMLWRLTRFN